MPVRAVPDVSFVYGLLHLYKDVHRDRGGAEHVSLETSFPLQGTGAEHGVCARCRSFQVCSVALC